MISSSKTVSESINKVTSGSKAGSRPITANTYGQAVQVPTSQVLQSKILNGQSHGASGSANSKRKSGGAYDQFATMNSQIPPQHNSHQSRNSNQFQQLQTAQTVMMHGANSNGSLGSMIEFSQNGAGVQGQNLNDYLKRMEYQQQHLNSEMMAQGYT